MLRRVRIASSCVRTHRPPRPLCFDTQHRTDKCMEPTITWNRQVHGTDAHSWTRRPALRQPGRTGQRTARPAHPPPLPSPPRTLPLPPHTPPPLQAQPSAVNKPPPSFGVAATAAVATQSGDWQHKRHHRHLPPPPPPPPSPPTHRLSHQTGATAPWQQTCTTC